MILPDQLAQSGSEHGQQAALFCWSAVAAQHGFKAASMWADGQLIPPFKSSFSQPVVALRWLHAIPNGGSRGDTAQSRKIRGAALKKEGVKTGVHDIFLPFAVMPYHGLYIEMKKAGKGRLSDEQIDFGRTMTAYGYACSVEVHWRQAAKLIERYISNEMTCLELNNEDFLG